NNQSSVCIEIKQILNRIIHDPKDMESIYYNNKNYRPFLIIIFEIFFGSFIRQDQYKIFSEIINEKKCTIKQMLMGKGKTSVITPLLMLHYPYNDKKNVILLMSAHLKNQVYSDIIEKYYPIINNIYIDNDLEIKRNSHKYVNI